jgi:hypothetical protein
MHPGALIGLMLAPGVLAGVAPGVQAEMPDAEVLLLNS